MRFTHVYYFMFLSIFCRLSKLVASAPDYGDDPCSSDNDSTNVTAGHTQTFWAGGIVLGTKSIPGRIFYDFDGVTVKDPIKTFGDAGTNSFRVETEPGKCSGPPTFSTIGNPRRRITFELDDGCTDVAVLTAQQAVAEGLRFPAHNQPGYNHSYGMGKIHLSRPFLDAKLVPDLNLFENGGTDGFLMTENTTGHVRGTHDGKKHMERIATGPLQAVQATEVPGRVYHRVHIGANTAAADAHGGDVGFGQGVLILPGDDVVRAVVLPQFWEGGNKALSLSIGSGGTTAEVPTDAFWTWGTTAISLW
ncbi:hypothetical protein MMC11_000681 [Xylographa trunciseda]|nr:hypothetical protein [Xylographa trunciseda]